MLINCDYDDLEFIFYNNISDLNKLAQDKEFKDNLIELSRDKINIEYINDLLLENIQGIVVKHKKKYTGIMFFSYKKDYIELHLVATRENNIKMGQYLLFLLEVYAKAEKYNFLKCESIEDSVLFYEKYNWVNIEKIKKDDEYIYIMVKDISYEENVINNYIVLYYIVLFILMMVFLTI